MTHYSDYQQSTQNDISLEYEGETAFWNVCSHSPNDMASRPRRRRWKNLKSRKYTAPYIIHSFPSLS